MEKWVRKPCSSYEKLYRKITELLGDRTVDESRLVTEAAVVAEKSW
ncbi:MAG: hypothetical protein ACLT29_02285 [Ruminococcus callidus]